MDILFRGVASKVKTAVSAFADKSVDTRIRVLDSDGKLREVTCGETVGEIVPTDTDKGGPEE